MTGPEGGVRLERGALGTIDLVFFVVAAATPLVVMAGVAPLAIGRGGIGAPGAYVLAGVVLVLFAVGYVTMSRFVPDAGAFYAYVSRAFGNTVGLGAAFLAMFAYSVLAIGIFGAFGFFAAGTADRLLGVSVSWPVWALGCVVAVALVAHRRITLSAKVLGVFLVAEAAILALLSLAIVLSGGEGGLSLHSFAPGNVLAPGAGAMFAFAFAAFVGFEATTIFRGEARDPSRTVARATYAAVGFLALFYGFVCWAVIQYFGEVAARQVAESDPANMFFIAAGGQLGTWAADTMSVLIVTSSFAAILAFHSATMRYMLALGATGALPRALARTHPRYRSPWVANAVQSALSAAVVAGFAIAGLDPYLDLLILVNSPGIVAIVALQLLTAAGVIVFFRRQPNDYGPWRVLIAPGLAVLGLAAGLALIVANFDLFTARGGTTTVVLLGLVALVFVAGLVVAARLRRRRPEVYARLAAIRVES